MPGGSWFDLARTAAGRLSPFRRRRPMPEPGRTAPDFDLPDHTGGRVRLSELRGKRVVLWFYPKADTPG
jgi:hypothetical protein